jgi:hypothetical protein
MELLQIIIFTLKLFALSSAIIVLLSYFIFKIKDRTRKKPYIQTPGEEESGLSIQVETEDIDKKPKRFKILNESDIFSLEKGLHLEKIRQNNDSIHSLRLNKKLNSLDNFNIYDYYSNSSFEPMHKIKL